MSSLVALQTTQESRSPRARSSLLQVDRSDGAASHALSCRDPGRLAAEPRRGRPPTVPVRHIFLLVSEFRAQCQEKAEPDRLAALLHAVIQLARHGFSMVEESRGADSHFVAENHRCLADLEDLLGDLLADNTPPSHELFHAMDPLIVQFVRIDALNR